MLVTKRAGTEHSHWGLWGTWRRGPDLVAHIARLVAEQTGRPAKVEVHVRDDVERASSRDDLESLITGNAFKGFRSILIEGGDERLQVRIAFVRRRTEIPVGARDSRRASIKHGVVLEVSSTDPSEGDRVEAVKRALAGAIERGRPRWITRVARHGRATRAAPKPGLPASQGGSASRPLEHRLRDWPRPSGFAAIFTVLSLAAYAGVITILANFDLYQGEKLPLWHTGPTIAVVLVGVAVGIGALVGQRWLFPAAEVSRLPNASRATKAILASASIPTAVGFLLSIPGLLNK